MPGATHSTGEFQDPLENYDPPKYDDPLEQALAEESVAAIQSSPYASVSPDTPVHEAVAQLAGLSVACLLVEEQGKLVGLLTERDVLDKIALEHEAVRDRPVRDVMTNDPVYVHDTDSAAAVLSVMAVSGYRHVPVVALDGTIVGLASPQRVTGFLQSAIERS